MIDRGTISLINGEVDGVNTPQESEILRITLANNPEARQLLEDLKKLERSLSAIPQVNPPTTLKKSVMRSIEAPRAHVRATGRKFSLADILFPIRSVPRLGFAFSGGVLAGILLVVVYFTFISHPQIDDRDASGTALGSSEALQTADDEAVTGEGVQGRVVTEYSSSVNVLRVYLSMQPGLTARFVYDPIGTKLKGVTLSNEFSGTLTNSEGMILLGNGGGSFRVFFVPGTGSAQNVRLQVVSAGNVQLERSFQLGRK